MCGRIHDLRISICDVGPRDGLQNDKVTLAPETRAELCTRLAATGLPRVEAASFVNPARVPQMAGAEEVFAQLPQGRTVYAALVLNRKGLDRALAAGAQEIHVAYPVTDTFAMRNQNMTTEQAAAVTEEIVAVVLRSLAPMISAAVRAASSTVVFWLRWANVSVTGYA